MRRRNKSELFSEIQAHQRSTIWPDTLRNSVLVDAFVWKGSPTATPVQRIGTALFGMLLSCPALLLIGFGFSESNVFLRTFMLLCAIPWIVIGCRLLGNAFRH